MYNIHTRRIKINSKEQISEYVESCQGLIRHLCHKYHCNNNPAYEDILQDLNLILVERAQDFDPKKGSFANYCYFLLRNRILAAIPEYNLVSYPNLPTYTKARYGQGKANLIHKISLSTTYESQNHPGRSISSFQDLFGSEDPEVYTQFEHPNLLKECLTPLEIKIIKLLYLSYKQKVSEHGRWRLRLIPLVSKWCKLHHVFQGQGRWGHNMVTGNILSWIKWKLTKKICAYYKEKGFADVITPAKNDKWTKA